jgi:hypothetical protein
MVQPPVTSGLLPIRVSAAFLLCGLTAGEAEALVSVTHPVTQSPCTPCCGPLEACCPGTSIPTRIAYVLEGTLTFERQGEAPKEIATGEVEYLAPNVVHRGINKTDKPMRLFVVRIKPKDKPLVEEVPPPQ